MNVFKNIQLPTVIYSDTSPYSKKIEVIEVSGTRKLIVEGVVQSVSANTPSVERMIWGSIADLIVQEQPETSSMLIFGLGGATTQHLISKKIPECNMVSVEIDEKIVEVARNFFDLDSISNHRVVTEDAMRVIVEPDKYNLALGTFDLILVDIYCGEKYPELGKSGNFLSNLKKLAVSGGLIIFNRIYLHHHQEEVTDVQTKTVAGKTNADNVLIFCRA